MKQQIMPSGIHHNPAQTALHTSDTRIARLLVRTCISALRLVLEPGKGVAGDTARSLYLYTSLSAVYDTYSIRRINSVLVLYNINIMLIPQHRMILTLLSIRALLLLPSWLGGRGPARRDGRSPPVCTAAQIPTARSQHSAIKTTTTTTNV